LSLQQSKDGEIGYVCEPNKNKRFFKGRYFPSSIYNNYSEFLLDVSVCFEWHLRHKLPWYCFRSEKVITVMFSVIVNHFQDTPNPYIAWSQKIHTLVSSDGLRWRNYLLLSNTLNWTTRKNTCYGLP